MLGLIDRTKPKFTPGDIEEFRASLKEGLREKEFRASLREDNSQASKALEAFEESQASIASRRRSNNQGHVPKRRTAAAIEARVRPVDKEAVWKDYEIIEIGNKSLTHLERWGKVPGVWNKRGKIY